jgi:transcriptional regulator with XRE-family HTH domain
MQLSQESLGNKLSLKRTSITNLEQGRQRISAYMLLRLSRSLGVPLNELVEHGEKGSELEHLFGSGMPSPIRLWIEEAVAPLSRPKRKRAAKT